VRFGNRSPARMSRAASLGFAQGRRIVGIEEDHCMRDMTSAPFSGSRSSIGWPERGRDTGLHVQAYVCIDKDVSESTTPDRSFASLRYIPDLNRVSYAAFYSRSTCLCPRVLLCLLLAPHRDPFLSAATKRSHLVDPSFSFPRVTAELCTPLRRDHLLPDLSQQPTCTEPPLRPRLPTRRTRVAPAPLMSDSLLGTSRQVLVLAGC